MMKQLHLHLHVTEVLVVDENDLLNCGAWTKHQYSHWDWVNALLVNNEDGPPCPWPVKIGLFHLYFPLGKWNYDTLNKEGN